MIPASRRVLRHLSSPRRHRDPAHAAQIAGAIYGGALRDHPELAEPITLALPRPVSRRGYLYQLTASAGWTSLPVLRLIRQPTLILAGDDDPIIPLANGRLMAALLPDARLHVYPDGHLGLLTRAAELAPVVSDFLLAVEPGAGRAVQ
jgi:pimeloyl-ACP methyl ester carboxylesterase